MIGRRGKAHGNGRGNWNTMHGANRRGARSPEYSVWASMHARCRDKSKKDYGGRGISVCAEWSEFTAFLRDMGPRPSRAHTIERTNNDLGYSPNNCIWATRDVQARNKRPRNPVANCKRGHPLSGLNLYTTRTGRRQCKECRRLALQRLQAKGYFKERVKARRNGLQNDAVE